MHLRTRIVLLVTALVVLVGALALLNREQDERAVADHGLEEFLGPWYEALEGQAEEPAAVVLVGDSITEGVLLTPPVVDKRVTGLLQEALRDVVGADGGTGYMPAYYANPTTADDTVPGGTPTSQESFGPWGLGGRALLMPGGATLAYPTQEASSVRVWYGHSTFVGGQGKVFVDGLDVTSRGTLRDGSPSGETIAVPSTETGSGLWWSSPELGPGEHRVEVRSVAPGTAFVHTGVEFLDGDEESGVHVYDAAHSGATTAHFAGEGVVRGHWADVAAIDPQLILVNLGTNRDEDHLDNLRTLVDHALEAAPRARIVLVDGYRAGTWTEEEWEQVREDKRQVAGEHPEQVAVFDLAAHWPVLAPDGSTDEGLMVPGEAVPLHPSEEGHARMAEIYRELLTPPG